MSSSAWRTSRWLYSAGAILAGSSAFVATGAPAVPDPCKLITAAELEQIAGPMKGAPKRGDIASGDVSCEYTSINANTTIDISLHEGGLGYWRKRNGGPNTLSLPKLGKDAFLNPDSESSADLYAAKGTLILRVSMPKGAASVDTMVAIAQKALSRL